MSIRVVCPHCEEEFNLQDDLRGKGMRCPECRKTFVVQSADPPPSAPTPIIPIPVAPPPPPPEPLLAGNVADFVPVLEADPASRPTLEVPYQRVETEVIVPMLDEPSPIVGQPEPLESVSSIEVIVPDLVNEAPTPKRSPSKPKSPSGPKEVDWRSEAPPILDAEPVQATPSAADKPSAPTKPKIRHEFDPDRYRQRRGTGPWKYVLLFLVVSIFGMGAYIGIQSILNRINLEKNLASTAFDEFKKSNFTESMKIYDELLEKFPTSEKRANYEFFRKLTTLHTLVSAVTIRDNPAEGVAKWDEFLKEYSDSPLVKPDENGYGYDVFEAGRKLIDAHADHVENNLKTFVPNRKDRGLLDKSEKAVDVGRKLIPVVDRYRIKEVMPLDEKRKRFDDLTGKLTRERERLAVIDPFRDLPKTPTDVRIAQFAASLKQARFETDTEALQIIDDAKAELRKLIRFFVDEKPSIPPPIDAAAGKIFVSAPLGESQVPIIVAPDAVLETFFAVVRGIVYAFDPDSGNLLWAARVGKAAFDSPAKVPERNGQPELVLIPTDLDGFGLTARVARSGQPKWYQPLAAPIAGRPIVIGTRIYVPLQDDAGTIVELEAGSGNRLGYLTLRQRIGAGAVRLGGTSLLYVLAEARRVFVIDVEPSNATGDRLPMRCLQVLATEHPDLSVKVPPILTGPIGEQRATRFLLLAQSDGVNSTRMRAFSLLPPAAHDPKVGPREVAPPLAASQAIPGHVWYAPHSDGERVAIVTDAGSFNLFGTNQDGNLDANLFAIPSAQLPTDLQNPSQGK